MEEELIENMNLASGPEEIETEPEPEPEPLSEAETCLFENW